MFESLCGQITSAKKRQNIEARMSIKTFTKEGTKLPLNKMLGINLIVLKLMIVLLIAG